MIDHANNCAVHPCTCAPDSYWVLNPAYGSGPSEPRLISRARLRTETLQTRGVSTDQPLRLGERCALMVTGGALATAGWLVAAALGGAFR